MAEVRESNSIHMPKRSELWPIEEVIPYDRNPWKHSEPDVEKLARGIQAFGFNKPIEVDEDKVLLAGHRRRLAAIFLGMKKIPVIQHAHLTDAEKRAYRIADNRLTLDGEWDQILLAQEAEAIATNGLDLGLTGFDESELDQIIADWTASQGDGAAVPVPEPPKDPITKPGDIWTLGKHRIVCGDATRPDAMKALLAGEEPELCITDPPYGVNYDPSWRSTAAAKGFLAYASRRDVPVQNDDRADWSEVWKLLPSKIAYVWHGALHGAEVAASLESAGMEIRSQIIWAKPHFPISRGHYHWRHEPCFYAVRSGETASWIGDHKQTTLWEVALDANVEGGHSTQKPIELAGRALRNHEGDVIDPFLGSGMTLIAAEKCGRRCFGIEINPAFCDVSVKRWELTTGQGAKRER